MVSGYGVLFVGFSKMMDRLLPRSLERSRFNWAFFKAKHDTQADIKYRHTIVR